MTIAGCRREIGLNVVPEGRMQHVFVFSPYGKVYESTMAAAWIRHVAGHSSGGRFVTAMMCMKDGPVRTFRPIAREEAEKMLMGIVVQALKPMQVDCAGAAAGGDRDSLPEEFAKALGDYGARIVSSRGKR